MLNGAQALKPWSETSYPRFELKERSHVRPPPPQYATVVHRPPPPRYGQHMSGARERQPQDSTVYTTTIKVNGYNNNVYPTKQQSQNGGIQQGHVAQNGGYHLISQPSSNDTYQVKLPTQNGTYRTKAPVNGAVGGIIVHRALPNTGSTSNNGQSQGQALAAAQRNRRLLRDPYLRNKFKFETRPKLPTIEEDQWSMDSDRSSTSGGTFRKNRHNKRRSGLGISPKGSKSKSKDTTHPLHRASVEDNSHENDQAWVLPNGYNVDPEDVTLEHSIRKKKKRKKLWICVFVIVGLLILGLAASGVAIYLAVRAFNGDSPSISTSSSSTASSTLTIPSFHIILHVTLYKGKFISAYSDKNTRLFQSLQKEFCDNIQLAHDMKPSLQDIYKSCKLLNISSGSIKVDADLEYDGVPSSLDPAEVKQTIRDYFENSKSKFVTDYGPDPNSIRISNPTNISGSSQTSITTPSIWAASTTKERKHSSTSAAETSTREGEISTGDTSTANFITTLRHTTTSPKGVTSAVYRTVPSTATIRSTTSATPEPTSLPPRTGPITSTEVIKTSSPTYQETTDKFSTVSQEVVETTLASTESSSSVKSNAQAITTEPGVFTTMSTRATTSTVEVTSFKTTRVSSTSRPKVTLPVIESTTNSSVDVMTSNATVAPSTSHRPTMTTSPPSTGSSDMKATTSPVPSTLNNITESNSILTTLVTTSTETTPEMLPITNKSTSFNAITTTVVPSTSNTDSLMTTQDINIMTTPVVTPVTNSTTESKVTIPVVSSTTNRTTNSKIVSTRVVPSTTNRTTDSKIMTTTTVVPSTTNRTTDSNIVSTTVVPSTTRTTDSKIVTTTVVPSTTNRTTDSKIVTTTVVPPTTKSNTDIKVETTVVPSTINHTTYINTTTVVRSITNSSTKSKVTTPSATNRSTDVRKVTTTKEPSTFYRNTDMKVTTTAVPSSTNKDRDVTTAIILSSSKNSTGITIATTPVVPKSSVNTLKLLQSTKARNGSTQVEQATIDTTIPSRQTQSDYHTGIFNVNLTSKITLFTSDLDTTTPMMKSKAETTTMKATGIVTEMKTSVHRATEEFKKTTLSTQGIIKHTDMRHSSDASSPDITKQSISYRPTTGISASERSTTDRSVSEAETTHSNTVITLPTVGKDSSAESTLEVPYVTVVPDENNNRTGMGITTKKNNIFETTVTKPITHRKEETKSSSGHHTTTYKNHDVTNINSSVMQETSLKMNMTTTWKPTKSALPESTKNLLSTIIRYISTSNKATGGLVGTSEPEINTRNNRSEIYEDTTSSSPIGVRNGTITDAVASVRPRTATNTSPVKDRSDISTSSTTQITPSPISTENDTGLTSSSSLTFTKSVTKPASSPTDSNTPISLVTVATSSVSQLAYNKSQDEDKSSRKNIETRALPITTGSTFRSEATTRVTTAPSLTPDIVSTSSSGDKEMVTQSSTEINSKKKKTILVTTKNVHQTDTSASEDLTTKANSIDSRYPVTSTTPTPSTLVSGKSPTALNLLTYLKSKFSSLSTSSATTETVSPSQASTRSKSSTAGIHPPTRTSGASIYNDTESLASVSTVKTTSYISTTGETRTSITISNKTNKLPNSHVSTASVESTKKSYASVPIDSIIFTKPSPRLRSTYQTSPRTLATLLKSSSSRGLTTETHATIQTDTKNSTPAAESSLTSLVNQNNSAHAIQKSTTAETSISP